VSLLCFASDSVTAIVVPPVKLAAVYPVTWKQVVEAAGLMRAVLTTLAEVVGEDDRRAWPDVVVPIKPARDVTQCLEFARDVSEGHRPDRSATLHCRKF
jgi:hypothetical protein